MLIDLTYKQIAQINIKIKKPKKLRKRGRPAKGKTREAIEPKLLLQEPPLITFTLK